MEEILAKAAQGLEMINKKETLLNKAAEGLDMLSKGDLLAKAAEGLQMIKQSEQSQVQPPRSGIMSYGGHQVKKHYRYIDHAKFVQSYLLLHVSFLVLGTKYLKFDKKLTKYQGLK